MMKCLAVLLLSLTITLAASTEETLEEFVNANNLFAASFYKDVLNKPQPNFLISPFSATTVLAFLQSGCKGESAEEIQNALQLPNNNNKIEAGVKKSLNVLKGNNEYTIYTANKMYIKEDLPIKAGFKKAAIETYQAEIESIDFKQQVNAASKMNQWVEKQTNNKIKNLIKPDTLNNDTVTILINALYFKGSWAKRFNEYATIKKQFHKSDNTVVEVDTMRLHGQWRKYYENIELNTKFLEIPFEGNDISMVIALPNEKDGLAALERQIEKALEPQKFSTECVNTELPKFKIETTLQLSETLQNLKVKKIFDNHEADLSGISGEKGDLVVSDVIQKTFIEVEEDGVEAAAATFVGVEVAVKSIEPTPVPKQFIADHPFIFYVKAKNFILFTGRVSDPSN